MWVRLTEATVNADKVWVNLSKVDVITRYIETATAIHFGAKNVVMVKETPEEIFSHVTLRAGMDRKDG